MESASTEQNNPPIYMTQTSRITQISSKIHSTKVSLPIRIIVAILGVFACLLLSSTRYNLSIAIISMVHDSCTPDTSICETYFSNEPPLLEANLTEKPFGNISNYHSIFSSFEDKTCKEENEQRLNWSEAEQGLALGAYYYGFATTHIFGAFHGVVHPALYFLFKKWFPKQEQSTALSMLLLGTSLGLILNVPIADAITYIDMKNGWQLLFYGGSLLHLIWIVLWVIFITDEPGSHHMIKDKEICYIRQNSQNILETNVHKAPWKSILRSKAVYASIAAKVCWSFNHAIIIDNGPSYLNKIAGFNMYQASVHVAIVYLFTSAIFLASGPLFIVFQKVLSLSVTNLRKLFQSIVFIGAIVTMFILPTTNCDEHMIIMLIIINMLCQGFVASGEYPLLVEYSGYYSGTVYGLTITFDSLARFIAPIIRGELLKNQNILPNWNIIFYITAGLNIVGFIIFNCFATSDLQEWALKKDMTRQISEDGVITKNPLDKPAKKEIKRELQNPNFRLDINTEEEDWKEFKVETYVP
ncbi:hypothetical protein RDWZM_008252 [Blomia tropicalis]|uniref:Uncharacterized protein n=1 Tax=Blomia tropicalis TaxID=40697 RepID=A0A9Q0M0N0_BLOTA|nr:hypothetical protein RDWZM_008252 [Blomia tropicalis]